MATLCNLLDFCFQIPNQCIQRCGCGNRRTFYNFDKSISVEPLVSYFKPSNSIMKRNLVKGMSLDKKILKKGLSPVEQIAAVVHYASENCLSARAVGAGHSWSEITLVRDILIDMTNLDKILEAKPQNSVSSIYHIEVQAGCTLKEFVREIDTRYGMSFPTLPSCTSQTIGGLVSTFSHGTGKDILSMPKAIVELHMIISRGVHVKIRQPTASGDDDEQFESVKRKINAAKYGDPPLEICSTDIFRAAIIGLGCMGIIYSVTFECFATYNLKETRRPIEIKWSTKNKSGKLRIPSELKDLASQPGKYLTVLVNPYPVDSSTDSSGSSSLSSAYFLAERTDTKTNMCCTGECCFTEFRCLRCCIPMSRCVLFETDRCASCAQTTATCFPSCVPGCADLRLKLEVRGQSSPDVGRWYEIFENPKGNLRWRQASYFVPYCDVDKALTDTVKLLQEYYDYRVYALPPISVRMVKADDLFLSPANRQRCDGGTVDCFAIIDVSFLLGAYGINEFHNKLESQLYTKYKARPHWAGNSFLNFDQVTRLYPQLDKWKRVYLLFNSDGTFDNEFTRTIGFEKFRTPDRVESSLNHTYAHVTSLRDPGGSTQRTQDTYPLDDNGDCKESIPTISARAHQQEAAESCSEDGSKGISSKVINVQHGSYSDDGSKGRSSKVTNHGSCSDDGSTGRSSKVISSQPKKSNDRVLSHGNTVKTRYHGKNHFTPPIPLSHHKR